MARRGRAIKMKSTKNESSKRKRKKSRGGREKRSKGNIIRRGGGEEGEGAKRRDTDKIMKPFHRDMV